LFYPFATEVANASVELGFSVPLTCQPLPIRKGELLLAKQLGLGRLVGQGPLEQLIAQPRAELLMRLPVLLLVGSLQQ
jgi:hypothetical protein